MNLYLEKAWTAWSSVPAVEMTDLPVAKAQLHGRVNSFDGGHTARWLASLREPTWRAVRDAITGHTIHCVSDRPWTSLTKDLELGLRLLAWMTCRTAVTWYWWDQDWVRQLPAAEEPRRDHLNGGWAVPGVPEVHVYRREEAHKVMLHETIHAISLDIPAPLIEMQRTKFEAILGRRLWPHLNECFTELYAEWLWCIARGRTKAAAKKNWADQLACSQDQAAAIWARIRSSTRDEDTNVFAYYILKWILMGHAEMVLLAPAASVAFWTTWYLEALPTLNQLATASEQNGSKDRLLYMGMTCNH